MQPKHHPASLQQQRTVIVWLLSLVLLWLPLMQPLLAHAAQAELAQLTQLAEPPCHQQSAVPTNDCPHCEQVAPLCDCENCGTSLSSSVPASSSPLLVMSVKPVDRSVEPAHFLPEPPPGSLYRPPRPLR